MKWWVNTFIILRLNQRLVFDISVFRNSTITTWDLKMSSCKEALNKGCSKVIERLCYDAALPLALSRKWVLEISLILKTIKSVSLYPEGELGLSYLFVWEHTVTLSEGWSHAADGCAFRQLAAQIVDELESNLQQLSSVQRRFGKRS